MELNILELRKICTPENIEITLHAAKRLEQRGILLDDVISCIRTGEIIAAYLPDVKKWEDDLKTRNGK